MTRLGGRVCPSTNKQPQPRAAAFRSWWDGERGGWKCCCGDLPASPLCPGYTLSIGRILLDPTHFDMKFAGPRVGAFLSFDASASFSCVLTLILKYFCGRLHNFYKSKVSLWLMLPLV